MTETSPLEAFQTLQALQIEIRAVRVELEATFISQPPIHDPHDPLILKALDCSNRVTSFLQLHLRDRELASLIAKVLVDQSQMIRFLSRIKREIAQRNVEISARVLRFDRAAARLELSTNEPMAEGM